MDYQRYAKFLPAQYTEQVVEATSTWWPWRGRRVHLARAVHPDAPVRLIGIHGGGGYSGALWSFTALAGPARADMLYPDLPLYGDTVEPDPAGVRYDDWLDLMCDLVTAERAVDQRPIVLFGASMGGLMAYEVAARTREVAAVAATCLLDPTDPAARSAAARVKLIGRPAARIMQTLDPVFGRMQVPVRWLVDMNNMSNNPAFSRLCATDPKGGGVRVPLGFLSSWLNSAHTLPEDFDAAPVTLVHPAADAWTPPELSIRFLDRIAAPTELVLLKNCGHAPIEEPGLSQLATALRGLVDRVASSASR